ncbi:MAG: hypothetical protein QM697_18660 [Lachnospiraceae bacterium]
MIVCRGKVEESGACAQKRDEYRNSKPDGHLLPDIGADLLSADAQICNDLKTPLMLSGIY